MASFDSSGVEINYVVQGRGRPIVLVHGFASSLQGNGRATGVMDSLTSSGRQAVALDCRGHGRSAKPHDPTAYEGTAMADDVIALMDHLGLVRPDLMGYSMGALIASSLLVRKPERFHSVILSGIGDGLIAGGGPSRERGEAIAKALEATDAKSAPTPAAQAFRVFAERSGNDLAALAAMQRSSRDRIDIKKLGQTRLKVLVLIGEADTLVGPADRLAATIPSARLVKVPGDHLSAPLQPEFRQAVVDFLAEYSPVAIS
jgi:pimeloyl-ACP methyl ester carboxylesterase